MTESSQSDWAPIRPVAAGDLPALEQVIDGTGLFPSSELAPMLANYLEGEAEDEIWLTIERSQPVAIAFCQPERMTSGTWNALLLAVHPDHQGQGLGAELMGHLEQVLAGRRQRILLVETSGLAEFERTRSFYRGLGYEQEARVRDYYEAGDDKVIFWKALPQGS